MSSKTDLYYDVHDVHDVHPHVHFRNEHTSMYK